MRFFGIGKKPGKPVQKRVVSKRRSFIYVALWDYRYGFKTRYLGKILAAILFVLTAIELIGPLSHLLPEQGTWIRFGIAGLLFTTAVLIIWQHHRAHIRTERYEGLLNSVMVQLEKLATAQAAYTISDAIRILDSLVATVGYKRRVPLFSATILKRIVKPGEPFKLYAQDSQNKFQTQFAVDETNSVAGKVIETDKTSPRALMYVPCTKYIHGVVITWAKGPGGQDIFMQTDIVPSAYSDVTSSTDPDVQHCLLCIAIPLQQLGKQPADPDTSAVLCLSGRKKDCMGALDFTAVKVTAVLLYEVMKNYR
jgi:hypothetical protein